MSKEYRFWQVEKRMFADKLAGEQRLLGDSVAAETQLADLDGQIRQARRRRRRSALWVGVGLATRGPLVANTSVRGRVGTSAQVRDRILGIKAQLLRSDETINKLLSMAVGR